MRAIVLLFFIGHCWSCTLAFSCEQVLVFESALDDQTKAMLTVEQHQSENSFDKPSRRATYWGRSGNSSCVASKLGIVVGGKDVHFSLESYSDLYHLNIGQDSIVKPVLTGTANDLEVRISGGDGGNSYKLIFLIKNAKLIRRTIFSFRENGDWGISDIRKFK